MIYDALQMSYRTIAIRKDPCAPKITELVDYEAFCGVVSAWQLRKPPRRRAVPPSPRELRDLLDSGKKLALIDVREPSSGHRAHRRCTADPASSMDSGQGLDKVPTDRMLVLYCKTGVRSAQCWPP